MYWPKQSNLYINREAAKTRINQTASFDILGGERLRNPRDTLTLPRHAQQRDRKLGCNPFLARKRSTVRCPDRAQDPAKAGLRIVGQEWPGCFRIPRQSPLWRTIRARCADRQENIFSYGNTGELTCLEQGTAIAMMMAQQEVGLAAKHDLLTRFHGVG